MKLMLGELTEIIQGISAIIEEKIPIQTSYWLTINVDEMSKEINAFEKNRQKLLELYAERDENGKKVLLRDNKRYKIKDEAKFQEEFVKLAETEVDINLKVFKLADFGDKADISINDLRKLKPIIKDFTEDDKQNNNEINLK